MTDSVPHFQSAPHQPPTASTSQFASLDFSINSEILQQVRAEYQAQHLPTQPVAANLPIGSFPLSQPIPFIPTLNTPNPQYPAFPSFNPIPTPTPTPTAATPNLFPAAPYHNASNVLSQLAQLSQLNPVPTTTLQWSAPGQPSEPHISKVANTFPPKTLYPHLSGNKEQSIVHSPQSDHTVSAGNESSNRSRMAQSNTSPRRHSADATPLDPRKQSDLRPHQLQPANAVPVPNAVNLPVPSRAAPAPSPASQSRKEPTPATNQPQSAVGRLR